jgi:phosphoglucosamine mutase
MVGWMKKYPQVLRNVPVKEKRPLAELNGIVKKIDRIQDILGDNGRVLVRYSGTEPLLRIMLEGPDKAKLEHFAADIADSVPHATA